MDVTYAVITRGGKEQTQAYFIPRIRAGEVAEARGQRRGTDRGLRIGFDTAAVKRVTHTSRRTYTEVLLHACTHT